MLIPSFGLHVNTVQAQLIPFDNPVDTLIARLADHHIGDFFFRSTVTHCHKQTNHQALEEFRCLLCDLLQ